MDLEAIIPYDEIAAICERYAVKRLMAFGSALRADFNPNSDLDLLVEFEPGHTPGLGFFTLQSELAEHLGRSVDLGTPNSLSKYIQQDILSKAVVIYDSQR
jgi:hypothetical protein